MNKLYALCGIFSPLIAGISIITAIYIHDFQFTGNALSDMGRVGLEKNYIFNGGLILSGIVGLIFGLYLFTNLVKNEKIPGGVFIDAAFLLICIGLFPEGTKPHFIVSVGFFLLALIAILGMGILFLKRKGNLGVFSIGGALLAVLGAFVPRWEGVAIPETIGAFFICLWMGTIAYLLWRDIL
jgi:hypothetical membrane protein